MIAVKNDIIGGLCRLLEDDNTVLRDVSISINADIPCAHMLWDMPFENAIVNYTAEIYLENFEKYDERVEVGVMICNYLPGVENFSGDFFHLFDLADSEDQLLADCVYLVTEKGLLTKEYNRAGRSVLYIDKFYIKPEFRGKQIGTLVFPLIINMLGKEAGVVLISAIPKEDDGDTNIEECDGRYESVLSGMLKFIEAYGFKELRKEDNIWARALEPTK